MKRKHLYVILAILALAVLIYAPTLVVDGGAGEEEPPEGEALEFPALAGETPVGVRIADPGTGDTLSLERGAERWTVDGHRADSAKVADLLAALDTARSTRLVARNPDNHPRLGVEEDGGRRVDVTTREGSTVSFFLGERDSGSGGYYARLAGSPEVWLLEGPVGGYLGRDLEGWRDRDIATVDTAAVREIVIDRGDEQVALTRGTEGWRVGDLPADSATVADLLRELASVTATGFPPDSAAATADFSEPDARLSAFAPEAGDVTGRALVASLGFLEPEGDAPEWWVKAADSPAVYELSSYVVRRLLPTRAALLATEEEPEE